MTFQTRATYGSCASFARIVTPKKFHMERQHFCYHFLVFWNSVGVHLPKASAYTCKEIAKPRMSTERCLRLVLKYFIFCLLVELPLCLSKSNEHF